MLIVCLPYQLKWTARELSHITKHPVCYSKLISSLMNCSLSSKKILNCYRHHHHLHHVMIYVIHIIIITWWWSQPLINYHDVYNVLYCTAGISSANLAQTVGDNLSNFKVRIVNILRSKMCRDEAFIQAICMYCILNCLSIICKWHISITCSSLTYLYH